MEFIPHHAPVSAPGVKPSRWILVLHGILGSGGNWRTIAKRLAAANPSFGYCLVDLRMHGQSQGAQPPHTIAAAAEDLVRLEASLDGPVRGVLGHSFGGKVALELVARQRAALEVAFLVDVNPGARVEDRLGASHVLATLTGLPQPFASREQFLELVAARGISRPTAEWLAMNVRAGADGFRIRLDLQAIRELLIDYSARDLWPVLESEATHPALHVIVGGKSDAFSSADRARLAEDARRFSNVEMHILANAGHNVHVDDPDALIDVIVGALGRSD